jgi:hypothetical protein
MGKGADVWMKWERRRVVLPLGDGTSFEDSFGFSGRNGPGGLKRQVVWRFEFGKLARRRLDRCELQAGGERANLGEILPPTDARPGGLAKQPSALWALDARHRGSFAD